jgi:hypothetical protein
MNPDIVDPRQRAGITFNDILLNAGISLSRELGLNRN